MQRGREAASDCVRLEPRRVACALAAVAALLILASTGIQIVSGVTGHGRMFHLVPLFNLDAEHNVPTLYSTWLLLLAAQLLAVIALLKWRRSAPYAAHWAILAAGFLFMAVDEACSLHELLVAPMHALLGARHLGIFYFAWVIPGMALVTVLGLFFARFVLRLPRRTRVAFLVAAAIYLGGAMGCEMVAGYAKVSCGRTLPYKVASTIEESMEMAGAIVFIWALLDYIRTQFGEIRFELRPGARQGSRSSDEVGVCAGG